MKSSHAFWGRRRDPIALLGASFTLRHPRFPLNRMLIRRGMDKRVLYAASRRVKPLGVGPGRWKLSYREGHDKLQLAVDEFARRYEARSAT